MTHPFIKKWYRYCPHCQAELVIDVNQASCPKCEFVFYNNPAPATIIILTNNQGQVLLGKRGINPKKGCWDNPGGFVEIDESIEVSAVREMKEETNAEVKIVKYLGSVPDIYNQMPTINFVFLVELVGKQQLRPQDDIVELQWFKPADIPWKKMAFANSKKALKLLSVQK